MTQEEKKQLLNSFIAEDNLIKAEVSAQQEVDYSEHLPFHKSILNQDVEEMQMYIDVGYDVNTKDCFGRTGLYYAIFTKNLDIVKMLVNAGGDYHFVDLNFDGVNLLHIALAENHIDMVKYFVEELKLDVNSLDNKGYSVLFYAMLWEAVDIAEYLIYHDAKNMGKIGSIDILLCHLIKRVNFIRKQIESEEIVSFDDIQKMNKIEKFIASC